MADVSYVLFKPGPGLVEHIALHIEHQIVAGILRLVIVSKRRESSTS